MTIPGRGRGARDGVVFSLTLYFRYYFTRRGEHNLPLRRTYTASQSVSWNSPKRTCEETRPFVLQRDYLSISSVAFHTGTHAHRLAYICRHTHTLHALHETRPGSSLRIANAAHYEYVTLITETQILGKRIASSRDPWREAARISHISTHSIATVLDRLPIARPIDRVTEHARIVRRDVRYDGPHCIANPRKCIRADMYPRFRRIRSSYELTLANLLRCRQILDITSGYISSRPTYRRLGFSSLDLALLLIGNSRTMTTRGL